MSISTLACTTEPKVGEQIVHGGWRFTVTRRLGWQEFNADMPSYVYCTAPTLEGDRRFIVQATRETA